MLRLCGFETNLFFPSWVEIELMRQLKRVENDKLFKLFKKFNSNGNTDAINERFSNATIKGDVAIEKTDCENKTKSPVILQELSFEISFFFLKIYS